MSIGLRTTSFTPIVGRSCGLAFVTRTTGTAASFGATAEAAFVGDVPVTINDPGRTAFVSGIAADIVGAQNVKPMRPIMGAEDFSHMLNQRPGAFIMIGNGVGPGLHNPAYNFNDAAIPIGVSYWVRLAERAMPI